MYDKSDQHATIYDSYNFELAAKAIKSIKLSSVTEIYSLTNEKKYSIGNLTQNLLDKQFVAWSCDGSSIAPLTDYMINPIYQKLIDEDDYNEVKSDERVYLDLRGSSRGRKRQKGGVFPFGLVASAAAPLLGEIEKPIFKKILVGVEEEENDDEGNNNTTRCATTRQITLPNEETFVA